MLVALRVAIGWHFYMEGLSHHNDPAWSSEGFLRQAKGPLAADFHSMLPSFHDWNRLVVAPQPELDRAAKESEDEAPAKVEKFADKTSAEKSGADKAKAEKTKAEKTKAEKPKTVYAAAWVEKVNADWTEEFDAYKTFYQLNKDQTTAADKLQKDALAELNETLAGYDNDIRLYRLLERRADDLAKAAGAGVVPNQKARVAVVERDPLGERGVSGTAVVSAPPAAWQSEAKGVEKLYHDKLAELLTDEQKKLGEAPNDSARLHKIDAAIPWMLMIVGGCLIVGLFSRLAAFVGALFLLSIIFTQPPWVADTVPTYNQIVECVAMLALSAMPAGRWAGLDYFIYRLVRPCCAAEGK
jgi:uncharacterized membrane protein YphA (DoxX/SURF4 family)